MLHGNAVNNNVESGEAKASLATLSKYMLGAAMACLLSGCMDVTNTPGVAGSSDDSYGYVAVDEDPLEPLNRGFFKTHTYIDQIILRPVAQLYNGVVPDEGRQVVTNMLNNLAEPVTFVNSVLQGDTENSFATLWRFVLNSTLGFAGAYDFAEKEAGLSSREADFGQTLAHYGVASGPYLFLPIIGPTTIRDGSGRGVDMLFKPLTWAEDDAWSIAHAGVTALDVRSRNMKVLDDLNNNSIDPYAAFRSAYLQRRAAELREWKPEGDSGWE